MPYNDIAPFMSIVSIEFSFIHEELITFSGLIIPFPDIITYNYFTWKRNYMKKNFFFTNTVVEFVFVGVFW